MLAQYHASWDEEHDATCPSGTASVDTEAECSVYKEFFESSDAATDLIIYEVVDWSQRGGYGAKCTSAQYTLGPYHPWGYPEGTTVAYVYFNSANEDGYAGFRKVCACCLLYTSPSPRDRTRSRMPSSA